MKKWCADNKCSLRVNDFTRTILHFEAHCDFPTGHSGLHMLLIFVFLCCAFDPLLLSACFFSPKRKALYRGWFKGADTTAVAKFLQYKYDVVVRENSVHKEYTTCILNALRSGNAFLSRLFRANLFMGKAETAELASFGRQLLDHYIAAANLSYTSWVGQDSNSFPSCICFVMWSCTWSMAAPPENGPSPHVYTCVNKTKT